MADKIYATNDGPGKGYATEKERYVVALAGDQTADKTAQPLFAATRAGRIAAAYLMHGQNGADAANPLNADLDVLINGVSALSTKPKLDKAAGTGRKSTFVSGTGITPGVVNTAADDVVQGDLITYTWNVTRTAPGTEIADVVVTVEFVPAAS